MKAFLGLLAVLLLISQVLCAQMPPPPTHFDYPPEIGPLSPQKAAAIKIPYNVSMSDINIKSNSAVLFISPRGGGGGYVGIDLLTGKLFPCKAPPPERSYATMPSPSGRLDTTLRDEGGFVIETSAGKTMATVKARRSETVTPVQWIPDESGVIYSVSKDDETTEYAYSIKDCRSRLVIKGNADSAVYSPDNHQIAFALKGSVTDRDGILTVLDGKSYRKIRSVGARVKRFAFSPDSTHIAFIEMAKDEFGDFSSTSLRVLDVETGRVTTLLTNRRKPRYEWAGNDALLVSTMDKYAVPSLSLVSLAGKKTVVTTNRNAGFLKPLAWLPSRKRAVYKISTSIYEFEAPEELWAVEPGKPPVRLFPVKGAGHE